MGWLPGPPILQLVKFCLIGFVFAVQGSAASTISSAPSIFSGIPPMEEAPGPVYERKQLISAAPSSESQPIESNSHPSFSSPPLITPYHSPPFIPAPSYTAPPPQHLQGEIPSSSHSISVVSPYIAPPPGISERHLSPPAPNASQRTAASPALAPSKNLTLNAPESSPIQPSTPESSPPSSHQPNIWSNGSPIPNPTAPGPDHASASPPVIGKKQDGVPVATPPNETTEPLPPPPVNHSPTKAPPPISGWKRDGAPIASPPSEMSSFLPPVNHSPIKAPPPIRVQKTDGVPVAAPPYETSKPLPPANHSPAKARSTHKSMRHSNDAPAPSLSSSNTPTNNGYLTPASSPSIPSHKQNHTRSKLNSHAPGSPYVIPPPPKQQGPVIPPSSLPTNRQTHYAPPPRGLGSSVSLSNHSIPKPKSNVQSAPSPSPSAASGWTKMPVLSPKVSPSGSSSRIPKMPYLPPVQAFPPPPPNEDCSTTVCTEPYTNTPPDSPCGCVLPMQVGLRLSVALYTFFPLVSELAQEIAAGVFMKQSQVRIMGATAASQQPEKTIVLIDLVPLGEKFDNTTAFLTYQRFWHKQVVINAALFGDYEVLYVNYTGLPASPPLPPSIDIIDDEPYSSNGNNARSIKPLGVDVPKKEHKNRLGGVVIAIIALSASIALVLCSAVAWVFLFRLRGRNGQPVASQPSLPPSIAKPSGTTGSVMGSGLTSASLSFGSSIPPYTGSAKTFSASDIERATNNFNASRVLGEGGFGRVYSGVLEDGTEVAVKVLKRDDQQGTREFLAEVEMLSRLHHRNLVKLIGICTEEHARCLVYELIPNGSVESHLHGVDKHAAPLDWDARLKIALGAARALAYLHEDSSPRVIHRDFKASNILLEHDFTPKVSDFGLARTAMEEENRHISTRVMGTFGYVAPEYAMTGHLLVKSDVYSYGVVLLELLTGRKPVDMSQPSGQENLVAWARPLLTTKEGLEAIIDPSLVSEVPFDSVAKVAAIASMCVQPEVSHRPFMGEVVQALKLVCNECDEAKEVDLRSASEELSVGMDAGASTCLGQLPDRFRDHSLVSLNYDSEPDMERGLSASDLFTASVRYGRQASGSFERCSSSGPVRKGRGRHWWQGKRRLTGSSVSEHGISFRLWPGSH